MPQNKFEIVPGLFVDENSSYKIRAGLLLKFVKKRNSSRIPIENSEKYYITPRGIESLIGAGAQVIELNNNDSNLRPNYSHEVIYKNFRFISSTDKPIIFSIDPLFID